MKKILFISLVIIILALYFISNYYQINLTFIKHNFDFISNFVTNNFILAFILYALLYIIAIITFLPIASLLTILAGGIFGLYFGTLLVSFASTIGAVISFLSSRYLFKDYFQTKFYKISQNINSKLLGNNAYTYLFFLRLNPLFSFSILNLLLGLSNVKLKVYFITTLFGSLLGTIVYVNAGRSLQNMASNNIDSTFDVTTLDLLLSFSLLSLLPFIVAKIISSINNYKLYKPFKKPKQYDYDMVVIGAGAGGLVSAYMGAFFKARVALIEENKMGGDCLNYGCVPSKALIHYANDFYNAKIYNAKKFNQNLQCDFKAVKDVVAKAINTIAPKDSKSRYESLGVKNVILGKATIVSPFEIAINNSIVNSHNNNSNKSTETNTSKSQIITTKNIIIATGATPFIPNIKGLENINYLTSNTIWDLDILPNTLIILGSGIIAIELGIAFAKLGSKVIIVEKESGILQNYEDEVADFILQQFNQLNIELLLNYKVLDIKKNIENNITLNLQDNINGKTIQIQGSHFLIATGKKPNVNSLGGINLEFNSKGGIAVNPYLQSNYKNIYALGDAVSQYQLTHVAGFEAPFAVINILFGFIKKIKINYKAIPSVIYSSPDVASVGLTSKQAKSQNIDYSVAFEYMKESDGAILSNQTQGFIKIIFDKKSKHILGVTICGKDADTMISQYTMAIRLNLKISAIYNNIYAYPSKNDIGKIALSKYRLENMNKNTFKLFTFLHKVRNILQ